MTQTRHEPPEWPPGPAGGYPGQTGRGPRHTDRYPPTATAAAPNTYGSRHAPPGAAPHSGTASPRRHRTFPRHGTGEWRTLADRTAPPHPPASRTRRADASAWHWLLFIPIVVPLLPSLYNRIEPTLLGIPFFYWSQLAFAFLASAIIAVVHRKVR